MATLKTLLVRLGMDTKKFKSGVNKTLAGLDSMVARAEKLNSVAKAGGLVALAGTATQLGAALAPAAGAMLAMPAAMATTRVASATLKLGLSGVSEAMGAISEGDAKKLDAALKELSPTARSFVKELGSLKAKAFDPIQKAVQSKLLSGLVGPLRTAAANVIPTVRAGLVGMAGELNGIGREALKTASTPLFRGQVAKALQGTTGVVGTLRGGVRPLITLLLQLVNLGMPLAKRMAGWAVAGAKAGAAFLTSERGASKLAGVVQRAGDTLATLGRIVGNLGTGLIGIFKNAGQGSGDLLATIEKLTAKFATWSQSAQGQQQIAVFFGLLAQTARSLGGALPVLLGPLGAIASLLTSLPAPAQEVVAKILAFTVIAGTLGSKLGPVVSGVRLLVTGIGKVPAAVKGLQTAALWLGKVGSSVLTFVVQSSAALGRFVVSAAVAAGQFAVQAARMVASMAVTAARVVAGWVLMGVQALAQAARVAAAWLIAMGPIGIIIAAVVALVALIVLNWETIKTAISAAWEWVQEKTVAVWQAITGALSSAWESIKSAAAATWEWIKNAVKKALDFISRFFMPFALIRLIAENWDKIKAGAKAAWDWVVSKIQAAVRLVIAGVGWLAELPGKVAGWFGKLKDSAVQKATELVTWVKELPGKILSALGNLGNLLVKAGTDVLMGLWNGLKSKADWLKSQLMALIKKILPDAVEDMLGIQSPSTVFRRIGEYAMAGLKAGLMAGRNPVLKTMQETTKKLTGTLRKDMSGNLTATLPSKKAKSAAPDMTNARYYGGSAYAATADERTGLADHTGPGGTNVTIHIGTNVESPKSTPRRNAEEMVRLIRSRGI